MKKRKTKAKAAETDKVTVLCLDPELAKALEKELRKFAKGFGAKFTKTVIKPRTRMVQ